MVRWLDELRNLAAKRRNGSEPASAASSELAARLDTAIDLGRKAARSGTKVEARLESLEHTVAELVELGRRRDDVFFAPLMDALDGLDAARAALGDGHYQGAEAGLAGIQQRLEALLAGAGYERHAAVGEPVDGRLQRVVGTRADAGAARHTVVRVVRAAVTRGEVVVRCGEVIASEGLRSGGEGE